jgi:hypothetical protein
LIYDVSCTHLGKVHVTSKLLATYM